MKQSSQVSVEAKKYLDAVKAPLALARTALRGESPGSALKSIFLAEGLLASYAIPASSYWNDAELKALIALKGEIQMLKGWSLFLKGDYTSALAHHTAASERFGECQKALPVALYSQNLLHHLRAHAAARSSKADRKHIYEAFKATDPAYGKVRAFFLMHIGYAAHRFEASMMEPLD